MFSKIMDFWMTLLGIKPVEYKVEQPVEQSVMKVEEVPEVQAEPEPQPAVDLISMTKKQLVEFADQHGIEVDGRKRKDTIIETIQAALG